jgi:hypothetical protein
MAEGVRFDVEQHQDKGWVRVEGELVWLRLDETLRLQVTNEGAATVWVVPFVRIQSSQSSPENLVRQESEPADPLELVPGASGILAVTLREPTVKSIGLVAAPTAKSAEVVDWPALKYQLVGERSIHFESSAAAARFDLDDPDQFGEVALWILPVAWGVRWVAEATIDTPYGHMLEEGFPAGLGLLFFLVLTIWYVSWSGYWRRWLFWRAPPFGRRQARARALELVLMVPLLTYLFVYLHVFLLELNVIGASAKVPDRLVEAAERFYLWHLIKSIPLLEIPDTFDWKPPVTYSGVISGLLLLTYRLLVLAPAIGLGLGVLQHWLGRNRDTSSAPIAEEPVTPQPASTPITVPPPYQRNPVQKDFSAVEYAGIAVGIGMFWLWLATFFQGSLRILEHGLNMRTLLAVLPWYYGAVIFTAGVVLLDRHAKLAHQAGADDTPGE